MNRPLRSLPLAFACIATLALALRAEEPAKPAPLPKTIGSIERLEPEFDKLVPADAKIEVLGGRFAWSEGPVWFKEDKYLLFSDIPNNAIMKFKEGEGVTTFLKPSGYTGKEPFTGKEPGTNGLIRDREGRLVMCCHGDRRVARREKDGTITTLADKFEGKRFNSPNDLIYDAKGNLYFTDPPYGLPKAYDDPARELDWCGVYRLSVDGKLSLLTKEMTRPNGIGLSPDDKTLYVAQSDPKAAIWKSFPVKEDGTLGEGKTMYDSTKYVETRKGLPDGLEVDKAGNIWATGPGGVLVFSPKGKLLGRIDTGERTANCTFGDDGSTLYMTADMYLCRIKTTTKGLLSY